MRAILVGVICAVLGAAIGAVGQSLTVTVPEQVVRVDLPPPEPIAIVPAEELAALAAALDEAAWQVRLAQIPYAEEYFPARRRAYEHINAAYREIHYAVSQVEQSGYEPTPLDLRMHAEQQAAYERWKGSP